MLPSKGSFHNNLPSVQRLALRAPLAANRYISTPKGFPSASLKHEKPAPHTAKNLLMGLAARDQTRGLDKINPARDDCATASASDVHSDVWGCVVMTQSPSRF